MKRLMQSALALSLMLCLSIGAPAFGESNCLPKIDFETDSADDPFVAGDVVDGILGLLGPGVTVTTDNPTARPAMIFDTASPTGGDYDLGTPNSDFGGPGVGTGGKSGKDGQNALPLGKVLIISEDGDSTDPDDAACGGTLIFTFEQAVYVERVQVIDIDEGAAGSVTAFDAGGSVVLASAMLGNRGNNSVQTVQLGASGVRRLEVDFPGSGALSEIVFCDESACIPDIDFENRADDPSIMFNAGDIIQNEVGALPQTVVASYANGCPAMIFDTANPTGGDDDLGTPNLDFGGPGLGAGGGSGQPGENSVAQGKVLIISEDGDPLDPDDSANGGTLTFTFDDPTFIAGVEILDIDGNETCGLVTARDEGGVVLASVPLANLGDNSFQAVGVGVGDIKTLEVYFQGSGAVAKVLSCEEPAAECAPSSSNLKLKDGKKYLRLKLTNDGADPVVLDNVDVTWGPLAGDLKKIKLGSTVLFNGSIAPPSANVPLTGPAADRTLQPGETKTLRVIFQRGVDGDEFHKLVANFESATGCTTGGEKNTGEPLDACDVQPSPELLELTPKNKQARGAVTNGGAQPATLDSITLREWSTLNGNLTKIKLGSSTIWTGSEAPPAAGTPLILSLSGAGRTLAVGQKATLRFVFENDAQDGPYDVEIDFSAGAATCDVDVMQEGAPVETFTLTTTLTGDGSGTITSAPAGITCGADCQEDYASGTVVTLTATPAADSTFVGWSGDADCADGSVTMDAAKTCTAQFDLLPPPATCPCDVAGNWLNPFLGNIWANFSNGLFNGPATTCTDDTDTTSVIENPADASAMGAGVDATVPVCQVFNGSSTTPALTLSITAAEAEACRTVLRNAAQSQGVACNP